MVRGFNGIYACALSTQVVRARAHPYAYIHFSWPRAVDCQMVRKSLRVETSLPARVTLADNSTVNVTLLDLSEPGSMLAPPAAIGAVGEHARIEFAVAYEGEAHVLNIPFIIRNIHPKEDGSRVRVGVSFESVAQNDALILHCVFRLNPPPFTTLNPPLIPIENRHLFQSNPTINFEIRSASDNGQNVLAFE